MSLSARKTHIKKTKISKTLQSKKKLSKTFQKNKNVDWDFLPNFLTIRTPSTGENLGHDCLANYIENMGYEVLKDPFGSLIVHIDNQSDFTVLIDAHLDEIAYRIIDVDDEGFLYFRPVGGSDIDVSAGIFVWIHTKHGAVKGLVGNKSIHLKEESDENSEWCKLYVDIGATSKEEALKQVAIGDLFTATEEFHWLNKNRLAGRALDNHVGCFIASQVLKLLKTDLSKLKYNLYFVFTVQEEIGLYGASQLAKKINPDLSIVIDINTSTDYPQIAQHQNTPSCIGKGPFIELGYSNYKPLAELLKNIAKNHKIQLQCIGSSAGGTNMDSYHVRGTAGCVIGVVARYLHSSVTVVDIADIQDCIFMTHELLLNLGKLENSVKPYFQRWESNTKTKKCSNIVELSK